MKVKPNAHAADMDGGHVGESSHGQGRQRTLNWATSGRCKLIVMAIDTGGRWSEESVDVLRELSHAKAQEAPSFIAIPSWPFCGSAGGREMLSVTCGATAFAALACGACAPPPWCHTGGSDPG